MRVWRACARAPATYTRVQFDNRRTHAKGNAADPLDRAEVLAKYAALAEPVLGADGAEALRSAVLDLDQMPEAGRLSGLLVRR